MLILKLPLFELESTGDIVNFGVCCQLDDAILRFSFHILKHETSNKRSTNVFSIGLEKLQIIVDKTNKISFFYLLED